MRTPLLTPPRSIPPSRRHIPSITVSIYVSIAPFRSSLVLISGAYNYTYNRAEGRERYRRLRIRVQGPRLVRLLRLFSLAISDVLFTDSFLTLASNSRPLVNHLPRHTSQTLLSLCPTLSARPKPIRLGFYTTSLRHPNALSLQRMNRSIAGVAFTSIIHSSRAYVRYVTPPLP